MLKKKKAEFFIISSSYFKSNDTLEVSNNSQNQQVDKEIEGVNKVDKIEANTLVYSLKSLANKQVAEEKIQYVSHQNVKENKTFTDEMFHDVWLKIIDEYKKKNRRLLASNMELAEKKATEEPFIYKLTFPSEGSKYIFEEEKLNILSRLRVELQNFEINFEIDVNEKVEVKQVYQSFEDKFEEMKTTYPFLQKMIETFQLKIKQ